ncbi:hypothetical protein OC861_003180 [Tilletia horrida]|nr:hypothetical protein OC861_003180 [Tilletia horrida]
MTSAANSSTRFLGSTMRLPSAPGAKRLLISRITQSHSIEAASLYDGRPAVIGTKDIYFGPTYGTVSNEECLSKAARKSADPTKRSRLQVDDPTFAVATDDVGLLHILDDFRVLTFRVATALFLDEYHDSIVAIWADDLEVEFVAHCRRPLLRPLMENASDEELFPDPYPSPSKMCTGIVTNYWCSVCDKDLGADWHKEPCDDPHCTTTTTQDEMPDAYELCTECEYDEVD